MVNWELTRLSCDTSVGCNDAGGQAGSDHDPIFFIEQAGHAYALQIADNLNGSFYAGTFEIEDGRGGPWLTSATKRENSNYFPTFGQRYNIDMSFVMYADRVEATMNVVLIGRTNILSVAHTFSSFGGFDPMLPYSVGIMNEDNPGERYMLQGAGIAPIPEPSTAAALSAGLAVLIGRQLRRRPMEPVQSRIRGRSTEAGKDLPQRQFRVREVARGASKCRVRARPSPANERTLWSAVAGRPSDCLASQPEIAPDCSRTAAAAKQLSEAPFDLPADPAVRLGLHLVGGLKAASAQRIVACLAVQHGLCSAASMARYFGRAKATLSEQMAVCRDRQADQATLGAPVSRIAREAAVLGSMVCGQSSI